MRILHVYRTYFPDSQGGLEEVIRQICINSADHGVESRVFTLSKQHATPVIDREEAQVVRASLDVEIASCSMSLHALGKFRKQVEWADLVHYHFPWPFADFLHFATRVNKPSVVTYHSDIVRQRALGALYTPLMNRFLSSMDRIICTSPNYFATSNTLSKFSDKVDIVPIGLNESSYPATDPDIEKSIDETYGSNYFLFVGVLRYYKGLHILLDAIRGANFNVVIVGSGPTETELRDQARSANLKNVNFAGYVDEKNKVALFKKATGVVFPSYLRSEAFGVTLLEGAMYERPLISTEVGSGTSHVNIHGETGYVVTPGSAQELREAMDRLNDAPDIARLFGKRARQRYERLFTGELMGARYAQIYRQLLNVQDETSGANSLPQVQLPQLALSAPPPRKQRTSGGS